MGGAFRENIIVGKRGFQYTKNKGGGGPMAQKKSSSRNHLETSEG